MWEISGGSWLLKIHIGPLRDTLRVERYKSNKHTPLLMPATAVVVVAGELKVGGGRLQGRGGVRRRRGGARGPADQFALRELHRGKSNSLSAPFYPEKCSATVRYLARSSRPSHSPRTIAKSVRTEKSGALSLLLERRLRRGPLPGKEIGSDYIRGRTM